MGVYYPVAIAVLMVRFDEGLDALPDEALRALDGEVGAFQWAPGGEGWLTAAEQDVAAHRVFAVQVVPKTMTIRRNSYRQADECSLTIPWLDLPLDARAIRSLGVACYVGTVDAATWDRAMQGGVHLAAGSDYGRAGTTGLADLVNRPGNLRFSGFADEVTSEFGDGGDTLHITARDWTQVLIDTPVPSAVYREVRWHEPIEDVVLQVLGSLSAMQDVTIHLVGLEPGKVRAMHGTQHVAGKRGSKGARPVSRSPKIKDETYWDLLTDLSVMNGLVCYADIWSGPPPAGGRQRPTTRFVLARPENLYTDATRLYWEARAGRKDGRKDGKLLRGAWTGPHPEPEFADRGREHPGTKEAATSAVMVYGRNIQQLSFTRRLARIKVPSIRLVCNDGKQELSYRYPEKRQPSEVAPSGLWAKDEERVIPVDGAQGVAELKAVAPQVFQELGRGDMTCKFETISMASLGGGNSDPDLLELRAGVPVEVLFAAELPDADPEHQGAIGARQRMEAMTEAELASHLQASRKLSEAAATSLAAYLKGPRGLALLARRWYVREVTHTWSATDGYQCGVEAINYQEARIRRATRAEA